MKFLLAILGLAASSVWASDVKLQTLPSADIYHWQAASGCDPNPGRCRVKDQSGSIEAFECRNGPGNWRCYADVEYDNGTRLRVWGGCYENLSDCFSTGNGAVDPCD
jgi:hypothetical protein